MVHCVLGLYAAFIRDKNDRNIIKMVRLARGTITCRLRGFYGPQCILTSLLISTFASFDTRVTSVRHSSCRRRISPAFCRSASTALRRASSARRLAAPASATFCRRRARSAASSDPLLPPPRFSSSLRSSVRHRSSSSRRRWTSRSCLAAARDDSAAHLCRTCHHHEY